MNKYQKTTLSSGKKASLYRKLIIILFGIFFLGSGVLVVRAVPPATLYIPGETLDPNCAPGDTNCSVSVIGSLNNLTDPVQLFAVGINGSDFAIASTSGVHIFNIPSASATARGLLTSIDWLSFSNKEEILTFSGPLSRIGNIVSFVGTTTDISEGINLYFTDERAQDAVGAILTDTGDIEFTYDDDGATISADLTTTGVSAGTYNTVTVDTKGRVSFGSNADYLLTLNGITAMAQTLVTGSAGSDFNIVSSGTTHTFNIPDASTTSRGLITTGIQGIAGDKTFVDRILLSAGTEGLPSLTFTGDEDTGVYQVSDNFISIVTGGTNRLRIYDVPTDPLDQVRVVIGLGGISSSKPEGLARDQLYVFGRINSSWNVIWEDFLGRGINQVLTADGPLTSNIYFDEVTGNSGQAQIVSSAGLSGIARLDNPSSPNNNENEWLGSGEVLVTEVSLNPVFEARILGTTNNNHRILAGFADLGVGVAFGADTNQAANEIFFRKSAAGTTWTAVTRSASGTENTTSTAISTGAYHTLRIELNGITRTAYFVIDGVVVATHSAGVPSSGTRLGYYVGNAISTGTNRQTDIDYIRVWSDDPASLPESAQAESNASENSAAAEVEEQKTTSDEISADPEPVVDSELFLEPENDTVIEEINEPVIDETIPAEDSEIILETEITSSEVEPEVIESSEDVLNTNSGNGNKEDIEIPKQEEAVVSEPQTVSDESESRLNMFLSRKIKVDKEGARARLTELEEQDISSEVQGFQKLFLTVNEIVSSAMLRIGSIIADKIIVKQLCIIDDTGDQICFTKNELEGLIDSSKK